MMSLTIKGDAKLNATLDGLSMKLSRNVVRGGMRKLAQVIAEEAKLRVSSSGGTRQGKNGQIRAHAQQVRDSIKVRSSVLSTGTITSYVYTRGPGAFVAPWLEYGTAAHLVAVREDVRPTAVSKRGKVRTWSVRQINTAVARGSLVIGDRFVGAVVSHPGATPKPFLRPAVDAKIADGIEAMAHYISARLERYGLNPPAEPEAGEE